MLTYTEPIVRRRQKQNIASEQTGNLPFRMLVPTDVQLPGSLKLREKHIHEIGGLDVSISYTLSIVITFEDGREDISPPIAIWIDEKPPQDSWPEWIYSDASIGDSVRPEELPLPLNYHEGDALAQAAADVFTGGKIAVEALPVCQDDPESFRPEGVIGVNSSVFKVEELQDPQLLERLHRRHPLHMKKESMTLENAHPFYDKVAPLTVSEERNRFTVAIRYISGKNAYSWISLRYCRKIEVAPHVFSPVEGGRSPTAFASWRTVKTLEFAKIKSDPISPYGWGQQFFDISVPTGLPPTSSLGHLVRVIDTMEVKGENGMFTDSLSSFPVFHAGDPRSFTLPGAPVILNELPAFSPAIVPSTRFQTVEFRSRWVHDSEVQACMACAKSFDLFRRRHHCRQCAEVLCKTCCKQFMEVPNLLFPVRVRVCHRCAAELQTGGRLPTLRAPDGTVGLSPPVQTRTSTPNASQRLGRGKPSIAVEEIRHRGETAQGAPEGAQPQAGHVAAETSSPSGTTKENEKTKQSAASSAGNFSTSSELKISPQAPKGFRVGYGPLSYRTPISLEEQQSAEEKGRAERTTQQSSVTAAPMQDSEIGKNNTNEKAKEGAFIPADSDNDEEVEGSKGPVKQLHVEIRPEDDNSSEEEVDHTEVDDLREVEEAVAGAFKAETSSEKEERTSEKEARASEKEARTSEKETQDDQGRQERASTTESRESEDDFVPPPPPPARKKKQPVAA